MVDTIKNTKKGKEKATSTYLVDLVHSIYIDDAKLFLEHFEAYQAGLSKYEFISLINSLAQNALHFNAYKIISCLKMMAGDALVLSELSRLCFIKNRSLLVELFSQTEWRKKFLINIPSAPSTNLYDDYFWQADTPTHHSNIYDILNWAFGAADETSFLNAEKRLAHLFPNDSQKEKLKKITDFLQSHSDILYLQQYWQHSSNTLSRKNLTALMTLLVEHPKAIKILEPFPKFSLTESMDQEDLDIVRNIFALGIRMNPSFHELQPSWLVKIRESGVQPLPSLIHYLYLEKNKNNIYNFFKQFLLAEELYDLVVYLSVRGDTTKLIYLSIYLERPFLIKETIAWFQQHRPTWMDVCGMLSSIDNVINSFSIAKQDVSILDLPAHILSIIFSKLESRSIRALSSSCGFFHNAISNNSRINDYKESVHCALDELYLQLSSFREEVRKPNTCQFVTLHTFTSCLTLCWTITSLMQASCLHYTCEKTADGLITFTSQPFCIDKYAAYEPENETTNCDNYEEAFGYNPETQNHHENISEPSKVANGIILFGMLFCAAACLVKIINQVVIYKNRETSFLYSAFSKREVVAHEINEKFREVKKYILFFKELEDHINNSLHRYDRTWNDSWKQFYEVYKEFRTSGHYTDRDMIAWSDQLKLDSTFDTFRKKFNSLTCVDIEVIMEKFKLPLPRQKNNYLQPSKVDANFKKHDNDLGDNELSIIDIERQPLITSQNRLG